MNTTNFGFECWIDVPDDNLRWIINEKGLIKEKKIKKENFVFAVWGRGKSDRSNEEWSSLFDKYKEAGITDFFLGASPEELERLIEIAGPKGLNIHAWIWTLNRPGDTIAKQHPEWYAVNRMGDNSLDYRAYVDYYQWLSPFSEGARNHIKNNTLNVAKIEGIASVHLDYVRYCDVILGADLQPKYNLVQDHEMPEFDYGYHPEARKQFKALFGKDPMEMEHPELSMEWRQFRLNAITTLVNELADTVHKMGHKISAAVFPFPEMSRTMVRQDWSSWNLDITLPMVYHNFYRENLDWIKFATEQGLNELKGKNRLYTGLYIPKLSPSELKTAILNAKAGGAHGVSLFDMNAITDEHLKMVKDLVDDN